MQVSICSCADSLSGVPECLGPMTELQGQFRVQRRLVRSKARHPQPTSPATAAPTVNPWLCPAGHLYDRHPLFGPVSLVWAGLLTEPVMADLPTVPSFGADACGPVELQGEAPIGFRNNGRGNAAAASWARSGDRPERMGEGTIERCPEREYG